ncbi:GcrA family cell cycle regulator [Brevundimonas balnearis]|uniref:GcrA family cell cycle regulator n=1 Tax=Brevundimonas balnearis TaxID=1572858 RepID=A0ABV6R0X4_9CAUL
MSVWEEPGVTDALIRLHKEGLSYSDIGAQLGVSRNAVAGKIARLGLAQGVAEAEMKRRRHLAHLNNARRRYVWTAEADALLREMAQKGVTKAYAARRLGITHDQVRNRIDALHLPWRRPAGMGTFERVVKPKRERSVEIADAQDLFAAPAPEDAVPLIGRPFGACAFPLGIPETPGEQLCCGHSVKGGGFVYCERHHNIAFRPGSGMSPRDVGRVVSMAGRATRRSPVAQTPWDEARAA